MYPADEANTKHPNVAELFNPEYFMGEIQKHFESRDQPTAFGQHTNAEISSQIGDTNELLASILSLMPQAVSEGGMSAEQQTLATIEPIQSNIPTSIDVVALKVKHMKDDSPLTVVLHQEIQRYNVLLAIMRSTLKELVRGIQGMVVISPELEKMMTSLMQN